MKRWEAALRLVGMGWYVGLCIVLGVLGGIWLDGKINTRPVMTIIGLVLGIILAFYGVYRMILPNLDKNRKKGD
ncbi:MAG TPA: AtpZ/AtpI family protein [Dehalococcoidales bacterium]